MPDAMSQTISVPVETTPSGGRPRVVIIGAGFAGLNAAKELAKHHVDVFIVDRKNHHTFQPLLYQVAMAVLSPAEIATPVRTIFRKDKNIRVFLGTASGFDLDRQLVRFEGTDVTLHYDYLIVAAGAGHAYFGHNEWAPFAPGLKTVEDALEIRRRILTTFEAAERAAAAASASVPNNRLPQPPLNFVIIGAGATGVELAGSMADIARKVLADDFRYIDPRKSRVILLEGGDRVLASYPEDLSASAQRQLEELGVEVRTNTKVTGVEKDSVRIGDEVLPAAVIMWAAGVAASPLGKMLVEASAKTARAKEAEAGASRGSAADTGELKLDRAGRVIVEKDLTIAGHKNVFVVGDLAASYDKDGNMVPGVAPAAMQMGRYAAKIIANELQPDASELRKPFSYWDKGSLATIGRRRAVGIIANLHLSGLVAWLGWLFIHLMYLVGFRNRLFVFLQWGWTYFAYRTGARLITDPSGEPEKTNRG